MKRFISIAVVLFMLIALASCGSGTGNPDPTDETGRKVDVDLTRLSSTMVYSEVDNMMKNPGDYIGKTVRMQGNFSVYNDVQTKKNYFSCIIPDATGCCSRGLEFVLADDSKYPDDYPALNSTITVVGEFDTYVEGMYRYCTLVNASFQ